MFDIPKRTSLSSQVAGSIRKGISEGSWSQYLPSERRLCELFQVSRPTIRTALQLLAKDELISIRQGRRNQIMTRGRRKAATTESRLVVIVTHEPVSFISVASYHSISEMRAHLAEHGFVTEIFVCQARGAVAQRRKLVEFLSQNRVFCCVLLSVSQEVQRWFAAQSIPALVLGSCHPAVRLPSLDVDQRSICRHAAGIFLSKGHRQMALIVPDSAVAGDLASEEGFLEAIAQHDQSDRAQATILRHSGTAQNISTKLDALFNSPRAPTALLVAKPAHVFIVIIYLLKRGLSVPDTVSLISRDRDNLFSNVLPPIAHYTLEGDTFNNRLTRLMLQMVDQGYLPDGPNLMFPRFVDGGTVKLWLAKS